MTIQSWAGDALTVAQVSTHTVAGTWATGDIGTLTCGGKSVTFTIAGVETPAAMVAGLVALWNASVEPTLAEITASDDSPVITLTSDTPGEDFVTTASETTAGDGTIGAHVVATANEGPNDWSTAENWIGTSPRTAPVDADDVVIEHSATPILWGLDQSDIELTSLRIENTFTGTIGLPRTNAAGYVEYRDTYLKISGTTTIIDAGGSGRIKIDFVTDPVDCTVNGSATAAESNIPVVLLLGSNAANTLTVNKGSVATAWFDGETATIATASVSYLANQSSDSAVIFGLGTTLGTVTVNGGTTLIRDDVTTVTQLSGTTTITGTATVGTLTVRGGMVDYRSDGTITAATVASGAVLDFRHDLRARTVTNIDVYAGAAVYDTHATVTWTNPIQLVQCSLTQVTLNLGTNFTWAIA